MFLPLKRPMALAMIAMLLLALSPAVLAADGAPDEAPPEITIGDWISGFFEMLKSAVTGPFAHPGQGEPPEDPPPPHAQDRAGEHEPPSEIGPGVEPGPP